MASWIFFPADASGLNSEAGQIIVTLIVRVILATFAGQGFALPRSFRLRGLNTLRFIVSVALCAMTTGFAGCRSATVSNESRPATTQPVVAMNRPSFVYVGDFNLGAANVQTDRQRPHLLGLLRGDQDPQDQIARLQEELEDNIVKNLNHAGMPADFLDPSAPRPTSGWLVRGEFLELKEGNRLQRAVIGFGVGDSSAKLYVGIADLAQPEGQNLLNFNANTTTQRSPGGGVGTVATHTPWGMVARYAINRNSSENDIKAIADAVSQEVLKLAGETPGS
jgi:Domain of unknown function (DUF4410)